jgi:hypothetical protein
LLFFSGVLPVKLEDNSIVNIMTGDPFRQVHSKRSQSREPRVAKTQEIAAARIQGLKSNKAQWRPSIMTVGRMKEVESLKERAAEAWAQA